MIVILSPVLSGVFRKLKEWSNLECSTFTEVEDVNNMPNDKAPSPVLPSVTPRDYPMITQVRTGSIASPSKLDTYSWGFRECRAVLRAASDSGSPSPAGVSSTGSGRLGAPRGVPVRCSPCRCRHRRRTCPSAGGCRSVARSTAEVSPGSVGNCRRWSSDRHSRRLRNVPTSSPTSLHQFMFVPIGWRSGDVVDWSRGAAAWSCGADRRSCGAAGCHVVQLIKQYCG